MHGYLNNPRFISFEIDIATILHKKCMFTLRRLDLPMPYCI